MKRFYSLIILAFSLQVAISQTTHQVCISEVYSTGACNSSTGVFTPGNLTIAVGDQIQFTTYMVLLGGYNGTHTIVFTGSAANNVSLPISTNILAPVTTVTTPPFTTPGVYPMECTHSNHCFIADLIEGWPCTGYSVTVTGSSCTADANFNLTASTVCAGTTVNFTNASTGATTYSWNIDESEFSTSTNSSYLFSTPGTYDIELIADGGASCLDSITSSVTVVEAAAAGSDNTASLCNESGSSIDLNTLLSGNNGTGVWAETSSSGQFDSGTGVFNASGLSAGNYTFTYTVAGNVPCPNDVSNFTVNVNQSPAINLNLSANTLFLGDSVYVDFTTSGLETGATFAWGFCEVPTLASATPFYYTYGTAGTLCVCVEVDNNNGCLVNECETVVVTDASGIDELTALNILVYPNPTKENFTIDLSKVDVPVRVVINDNLNRVVRNYEMQANSILQVETNGMSQGIYQVRIEISGKTLTYPVILQ
ncbi:MAG: T9SS type A sorting domain-containing protein [Crocinitomicaceae bacterium]|nr:T9SS type A sorting domain-containing protein [Crocinitomicaceae bacterium]